MDLAAKLADPGYLSDVLRRAGVLTQGRVAQVDSVRALTKFRSRSMRLLLTYHGAEASAPSSLFLKTALAGEANLSKANIEPREVAFYRDVSPLMPRSLVPHCYEAMWCAETMDWHLLLEDLTETHVVATKWPLPPTLIQCEMILRTRANVHAIWWNDARLGHSVGAPRNTAATQRFLRSFEKQFAWFVDQYGELVPNERLHLIERLLQQGQLLAARYDAGHDLTLVHGDAHVWNCFLPRNGTSAARLFDWEDWRVSIATDDLAYTMAVHWYPDRRNRHERALLDYYHATLLRGGVSFYDRVALQDDYRLSVLWHVLTPVWQAAHKIPPAIWWNNLERIFLAVDDLDCRDLLQGR